MRSENPEIRLAPLRNQLHAPALSANDVKLSHKIGPATSTNSIEETGRLRAE